MRVAIKNVVMIAVIALLGTSCTADATEEAVAAEPTTTAMAATTTEPPDPAEKAADTQEANTEAFLAQDLDAYLATITEDAEFFNDAMRSHWSGKTELEPNMRTIFAMTDPEATEIIGQFVSADGTFGVVNAHWVGENSYGGHFDLTYVQLMEFEDGLIDKFTMYWKDQDVEQQLTGTSDS